MTEKGNEAYSLSKDESVLVLRTKNFVADKGSLLHGGIYNREFSSILASFSLAGLTYFLLATNMGQKTVFYAVCLLVFVVSFPLFRAYVFREKYLEAVFDRGAGSFVLSMIRLRKRLIADILLSDIKGLFIDTKKTEIMNRDGVEFVEKISAQHNTVIPGFGEETIFYSLKIKFADGPDRTIFAHSTMQDVIAVYDEIRDFLKL